MQRVGLRLHLALVSKFLLNFLLILIFLFISLLFQAAKQLSSCTWIASCVLWCTRIIFYPFTNLPDSSQTSQWKRTLNACKLWVFDQMRCIPSCFCSFSWFFFVFSDSILHFGRAFWTCVCDTRSRLWLFETFIFFGYGTKYNFHIHRFLSAHIWPEKRTTENSMIQHLLHQNFIHGQWEMGMNEDLFF